MWNQKSLELLDLLLEQDDFVTLAFLGQHAGISPRSVRYWLDRLDEGLISFHLPPIERKRSHGIRYSLTPDELIHLRRHITVSERIAYGLSAEERSDALLSLLLSNPSYVTLQWLAEQLDVSRTTVVSDIQRLRQALTDAGLRIRGKANHGIRLVGEERALRRCALSLFRRSVSRDGEITPRTLTAVTTVITDALPAAGGALASTDVSFIEECVSEAEKQLETSFSDESFYSLTTHIAVALQRIEQGNEIHLPDAELDSYRTTPEFLAASAIAGRLEEKYGFPIPYTEIGYMTIHLLSATVHRLKPADAADLRLQVITHQFMQDVATSLTIPELLTDEQLFQGLYDHLKPALYRLRNNIQVANPILDRIKREYGIVFAAVAKGLAPIAGASGKVFGDAEIGYLALHVSAAVERLRTEFGRYRRVLVVCGSGIGTASLLSAKLRQHFAIQIAAVTAKRRFKELVASVKPDIIVSTVPLTHEALPVLVVHPLLTETDLQTLQGYLPPYRSLPATLISQVVTVMQHHGTIHDEPALRRELATLLNVNPTLVTQGGEILMLRDLLTPKAVRVQVHANNWEDVVRIGGQVMVDNGLVTPGYIDAMVKTVIEMGPYIVIAPGIAMPHARPEDGALQVGVTVVALAEPVNFGNAENDPVSVAVFLCAVDKTAHLQVLSDLMGLFEDEHFVDVASKAQSDEELYQYIMEL